ncbi:hypothetical protein [Hymenobacter baengnokdamensis]|uniref:hypothetical protein n=1 Tax=Hymenobacter baengnokdamensis TaxID=2615203 RepID=UPI0012487374|nr:hypothetical protein [Hymenobacter baengnokdamensis]
MLFYLLPYLLLYLLNVPLALLTAYIAYSHGQSVGRWLVVGLVLPFVSVFLAIAVAVRHKQRAAAARGGAPAPVPQPGEFE